jgi:signal transduction histidine kinase
VAAARSPRLTLHRAIVGAIAGAILAGIVPAGIALDRRLAAALERQVHDDLARAPRLFADRMAMMRDGLMMRAKDLAQAPGLARAIASGDRDRAAAIVRSATAALGGGQAVVVAARGEQWLGPSIDTTLIERTRAGELPVELQRIDGAVASIATAPVVLAGEWVGAVGVSAPLDALGAEALAGLTRSGVVIVTAGGSVIASTLDSAVTSVLAGAARAGGVGGEMPRAVDGDRRMIAVSAPMATVGTVVFARFVDEELAVLPALRRRAALAALAALAVALGLGALLAARIARPVRQLAGAASALGDNQFDVPVPRSRITEVDRVGAAFDDMRRALAERLAELHRANEALSDRNMRLSTLQADLMQRDRLAATGRLVVELAHEIRNPVASLRNCLELIRRRVANDVEAREFADLAIDELLRMHELAERMLDLNRPRGPGANACAPVLVAREVVRLAVARSAGEPPAIIVRGDEAIAAAIAPDALKQVLMNLVQNAQEAGEAATRLPGDAPVPRIEIDVARTPGGVSIDVVDDGPGIPREILGRVFDPFFTTKDAVRGVGLGLFVAEGLVRAAGGRITTESPARRAGALIGGTRFRIELTLPAVDRAGGAPATAESRGEARPTPASAVTVRSEA